MEAIPPRTGLDRTARSPPKGHLDNLCQMQGLTTRTLGNLLPATEAIRNNQMVGWSVSHCWEKLQLRSEEHTSELQSQSNLVCRLLLEKKNFTRRQVAIQNRVASNIGISQSTFSVKVLNLFSRSRRKTNKRKSKHSAMLRNKETRHRMFIGLLNTTRKLA